MEGIAELQELTISNLVLILPFQSLLIMSLFLFIVSGTRVFMLSFFRADCDGGLRAVRCRLQHGRCGGNEEPTRSVCSSTESTAGLTLL